MTSQPIPNTLDEAVDQLLASMSEDDKARYAREDSEFPGAKSHFTGGMAMRNGWDLWQQETGLGKWFYDRRVFHGDDKSCVVYRALWRRINGLPISDEWMAEQAVYFEAYWAKSGLTWDQQPIPGSVPRPTRWFELSEGGGMREVDDPYDEL